MSDPSSRVVWQLGPLDPNQVRVVVHHYRHRYPALDWGWLLNALAELRLVAEPQDALAGFAKQQQLESAVPVPQRFLQDLGCGWCWNSGLGACCAKIRVRFSTDAPESAQIPVTAMDSGERMGHAKAQVLPSLAA
ncbi:MAG: hypothetical protein ACK55R_14835, partial [Cyanobacteriota bacterium]